MNKKMFLFIVLAGLLFVIGCNKQNNTTQNTEINNAANAKKTATVEEDKIEEKYEIVALTRNIAIILNGIEYEKVTGVVDEAKNIYQNAEVIGNEENPDSDKIFDIYPDLTITDNPNQRDFLDKLGEYNFKKQFRSFTMPLDSSENLEEYIYSLCRDIEYPKYSKDNPIPEEILSSIQSEMNSISN